MASVCKAVKQLGPFSRALVSLTRAYGYVHVPKKTYPHILGPGSWWRKCNVVYPINKIQDSFIKFKWLTKTASVDELPSTFSFKPISEAQLDDVECRATEALVFQRPQEESGLYRKSYQAFFQSLLASAWIHGEEYPHLLRSHFLAGPKVSYWKHGYITVLVTHR